MSIHVMIEADMDHATVGFWCDTCSMPSAIEVPLLAITMDGVDQFGTVLACTMCASEDWEGGEDD